MSKEPIRPSTLVGIKRYAKTLKASLGLKHAAALDAAAVAGGFQNFMRARRQLGGDPRTTPGHMAYITTYWRVRETGGERSGDPLGRAGDRRFSFRGVHMPTG